MKRLLVMLLTGVLTFLPLFSWAEMIVEPSDADIGLDVVYPIAEEKALSLLAISSDELYANYDLTTNLVQFEDLYDGARAWVVVLQHKKIADYVATVIIESPTQEILFETSVPYDVETIASWEEEKGDIKFWSLEEQRAFGVIYNMDPMKTTLTEPSSPAYVDQESALTTARQALIDKYGLSGETINGYLLGYSLLPAPVQGAADEEIWMISFYSKVADAENDYQCMYQVNVLANTGEILLIMEGSDSFG